MPDPKSNDETQEQRIERRVLGASDAELRVSAKDKPPHLEGYGARFNRDSEDLGFIERIKPGAFADALKISDVRGLFNHDANYILGRVAAGTMKLAENNRGLKYDIEPPNTAQARGVLEAARRGDVTGSSFSFIVAEDGDEWTEKGGEYFRTITKFKEIFDVGPVTFPAYGDTSVAVRSLDRFKEGRADESCAGCKPYVPAPGETPPPSTDECIITPSEAGVEASAESSADETPPEEPQPEPEAREENEPTQMEKNKQLLDEADARRREAARQRVAEAIAAQ